MASKAARIVEAARRKKVIEFGLRRAHGPQAALLASRAAYIGGCQGTSNCLAADLLEIPLMGTMAHSWVMSGNSEQEALREFRQLYPDAVLLIDTYDTAAGAKLAAATGDNLAGVRIDSGDLLSEALAVRQILDQAGQPKAVILLSGNLDEKRISQLEDSHAPVDAYAVGTDLVLARDAPSIDIVYKLVEVQEAGHDWRPVVKTSANKRTVGGRKQIWRQADQSGTYLGDLLALEHEQPGSGEPLLAKIMEGGRLTEPLPTLTEIRAYADAARRNLGSAYFLSRLSDGQALTEPKPYPVQLSEALSRLQQTICDALVP